MNKNKYEVSIYDGVVASNMEITIALVLVKALFDYYQDESPSIVIREMARAEACNCDRIRTL